MSVNIENKSTRGFGWAIVKDLADAHYARLYIGSEEGKGSQFVVHFPGVERASECP
ncbi:hypothetical protein QTO17_00845 [Vibrio owensii]